MLHARQFTGRLSLSSLYSIGPEGRLAGSRAIHGQLFSACRIVYMYEITSFRGELPGGGDSHSLSARCWEIGFGFEEPVGAAHLKEGITF